MEWTMEWTDAMDQWNEISAKITIVAIAKL